MLDRIKALIGAASNAPSNAPTGESHDEDELRIATAALLIEAAFMDGHFDESERQTISSLLGGRFCLTQEEVGELMAQAEDRAEASNQLYAFTRVIKDRFSHQEKVTMIEMLWRVVLADGRIDDFEANLMRRVAGLIYVSDRESGQARKRVIDDSPS